MPRKTKATSDESNQLGLGDLTADHTGSVGLIEPTLAKSDLQVAIDAFDAAYRIAYDGARPSWGPKTCGQLKRLVVSHTATVVVERIASLFGGALPWIAGRYDVGALVSHFDKLGETGRVEKQRGMTPAEIIAWGQRTRGAKL